MKATRAYVAIRTQPSRREWIDIETIRLLPNQVLEQVKAVGEEVPRWAKDNPVVRIVRVEIRELDANT